MKYIDITKAAYEANGRSRACQKCHFKGQPTEHVCEICSTAFVEGFQKGAAFLIKEQQNSYKELIRRFNKDYGTVISRRKLKLYEEIKELEEALIEYSKGVRTGSNPTYDSIKDEIGDVLVVITHISHLLGTSATELLNASVKKNEIRKKNPNYKRNHEHKDLDYETEKRNN